MWPFKNKKKAAAGMRAPVTIVERVAALLRANIHSALDAAEDPEKALDLFVRDFAAGIGEAEEAVAETIGAMRLMQADRTEAVQDAEKWGQKAEAASRRSGERYERLAAEAVSRQIRAEDAAERLDAPLAQQAQVVEQLKHGLDEMRSRLAELESKRSELIARSRVVDAQERIVDAVRSLDGSDPSSQLGRFERGVKEREALAMGRAEVAASSMSAQFDELEAVAHDDRVAERLAALRTGPSQAIRA